MSRTDLNIESLAKGFAYVLGLGAWPRVSAACSWFVPPRCVPGPGPVDVDVDAEVDAGGRGRGRGRGRSSLRRRRWT